MITLGIKAKILMLIMVATLGPLVFLNLFWTHSERQTLINDAKSRQTLITQGDANNVNDFITEKIRNLIIHSQSPTLQQLDLTKAPLAIGTLLYQDKDLTRAALVDQKGQEVVALTSDLKKSTLQNVKDSNAFKVVNYFAGNQYVSPVSTDATGQPTITVAVPLVTFTTPQELGSLSTSEPGLVRNPEDIKGALIVQVSLKNLWSSVLATSKNASNTGRSSSDGYAYVVDDKGVVIAHPSNALTKKDLSSTPIVTLFKQNLGGTIAVPQNLESQSEKGIQVMATYQKIPATSWGVVFEEPMSSIYKDVNRILDVGLVVSALAIVVMAILSFWLSKYITDPILTIAQVARSIGRGNFFSRITLNRHDEVGQLAASVNTMGGNLKEFVGRIEAQKHQLEIILNSTTDGIFAVDAKGEIIIANNAAALFCEQTRQNLVGQRIDALLGWTQNTRPCVIDYTAAGTHTHYDLQYVSGSGIIHFANLITVATPGPESATQTIVTIHDETKSRELEDMKIDFVSMAAHELRTPLSTIRGYLELIDYQPPESMNQQVHKYITQARGSAEELATLISNLLDVSRIERGTLVLSMEKMDFSESAEHIVHNLQLNAQAKQITLTYTGPSSGYYIIADSVAMREVIGNLVENAIKYTPSGGEVTVGLVQKDDQCALTITDNGMGIPANALPYLFTKFYRVHGGLESGSTGTGLGLFISKSIIERHSGTITVESNEGHGSTFTVAVPLFDEDKFAAIRKAKGVEDVSRRRGWTTKNIAR